MTDLEILESCINEANNISVPTMYTETIALPIANISNKLKLLRQAILIQVQKAKEAAETGTAVPAEVQVGQEETAPEKPGE